MTRVLEAGARISEYLPYGPLCQDVVYQSYGRQRYTGFGAEPLQAHVVLTYLRPSASTLNSVCMWDPRPNVLIAFLTAKFRPEMHLLKDQRLTISGEQQL